MSELPPIPQSEIEYTSETESIGDLLERFGEDPPEVLSALANRLDAFSEKEVSNEEFVGVMAASAAASIGAISLVGGASPQEANQTVGFLGRGAVLAIESKALVDQLREEPLKRSTYVGPKIAEGMRRLAESLRKES